MTVAPGATEATLLAETSGVRQSLDGRLYFATVRGMETWAPGETATVVHDVAPREVSARQRRPGRDRAQRHRLFWAGGTLPTTAPGSTPRGRTVRSRWERTSSIPSASSRSVTAACSSPRATTAWTPPLRALWVSDGTEAGTRRITETDPSGPAARWRAPRTASSAPERSPRRASSSTASTRTPEGSGLLVDINRRTVGSDPSDAARVGDRVVFKTNEQQALWVTDGTHDGTVRLLERDGDGLPLDPWGIASDGTTALFAARDGIYRTDGTPGGTAAIADIGADPESFTALARVGTTSVFTARVVGEIAEATDLWRTDGTAAGTQRLTTGAHLSFPEVALGGAGTMLVSGYGGLWATDGTAAGSRHLFAEHRGNGDTDAIDGRRRVPGRRGRSHPRDRAVASGRRTDAIRGSSRSSSRVSGAGTRARSAGPATACCSSPRPKGRSCNGSRWTWRRSRSTR